MSHRFGYRSLFFILLLALASALPVLAQTQPGRVVLTAGAVLDSAGSAPLTSGQLCVLTTDGNDVPMGYNVGGGGQTSASPSSAACTPVTAGAAIALTVINSAASNPRNAYLRVSTRDANGNEIRRSKLVQTGLGQQFGNWCSLSGVAILCNWDMYPIGTVPQPLVQVGPSGAPGASATTTADGSNGDFHIAGMHASVGNTGLPSYPASPYASQDPAYTISNLYTDSNSLGGTGSGYAHAIADLSLFQRTANCYATAPSQFPFSGTPCAYASYDTRAQVTGTANQEHFLGFQSLMGTTAGYSGTINRGIGFFGHFVMQSGTLNNWIGAYFDDSAKSSGAHILNQYGVYVDYLTQGEQGNFPIYVRGIGDNGISRFGGPIQGGASGVGFQVYADPAALPYRTIMTLNAGTTDQTRQGFIGSGTYDHLTGDANGGYLWRIAGLNIGHIEPTVFSFPGLNATYNSISLVGTGGGPAVAAPLFTPSSSSATCVTGQMAWDAGFIYVCVSTNHLMRVALASF